MIRVQNCSAVGIIHREEAPGWVFIETKTPGYPVLSYVGKGLLPGGNWVRPNAADDGGPLGTYIREIREELSFGNPAVDPGEMDVLFGKGHVGHPPAPRDVHPTKEDEATLAVLIEAIRNHTVPFGAFVSRVDRRVFDMGNPKNKMGTWTGLISVFSVPLPDDEWFALVDLQTKFGNLSNESQSIVTSVWEISKKGFCVAWGQDVILQEFFAFHGFQISANVMPIMPCTRVYSTSFCDSYAEYLREYDVEKIPEGVIRPTTQN